MKHDETKGDQPEKLVAFVLPIIAVAEFLDFKNEDSYLESDLESAIMPHIRDFLTEMGSV